MATRNEAVVAEATLDYGGPTCETAFIFEFRGGKITKETAYWRDAACEMRTMLPEGSRKAQSRA